jgi:hypothetical protein
MNDFPIEIIDRISSFLDLGTLKRTLFVSRAFQASAEYHSGAFRDFVFKSPVQQAPRFLQRLQEQSKKDVFSKFLDIYSSNRFRYLRYVKVHTAFPALRYLEEDPDDLPCRESYVPTFRTVPNDHVIIPFLTAFAKATSQMHALRAAVLWTPIENRAWGLAYTRLNESRPLETLSGMPYMPFRQIWWSVGDWRPQLSLHRLLQGIGATVHGERLQEYWIRRNQRMGCSRQLLSSGPLLPFREAMAQGREFRLFRNGTHEPWCKSGVQY